VASESAVTLTVCQAILTQIAATKAPVSEVRLPPTLYNMVLIERPALSDGASPSIAGVRVSRGQ
jgi:hypothetical protein